VVMVIIVVHKHFFELDLQKWWVLSLHANVNLQSK
jgi:hypothetical protein